MSFTVSVGITTAEKRALDKNFSSAAVSHTAVLRNESSVVDPVILFDADAGDIATCNYMHIAEFGRYYFITDVVAVNEGLCEIHGHVDVLKTYASSIRTNMAVISRSATQGNWNLYLNDPCMKITSKSTIVTKTGWTEFPKDQYSLMLQTLG